MASTRPPDWNPSLYTRFEDERTRPAADLLARVRLAEPARVVDLGCGPGNSTALLRARWPRATLLGVDNSPAMIAAARQRLPDVAFTLADIAALDDWCPPGSPPDVVVANAALQWVPDHGRLLPALLARLAPGGALAVQMPDNLDEPSHALMREVAALPPFAGHLGGAAAARTPILSARGCADLLARDAEVDVWRTTYHHPMDDAAAIVAWLRATGLKPFVDPLPPDLQDAYLAEYQRRIDAAYPPLSDGRRLLAFPRLFIVAHRHRRGATG